MRRPYLDVMRGIAVLIMIEAHALDAWTREADRGSDAFGYALILGGVGAPIFLLLAGIAVPLSAGSKLRKGLDVRAASRAVGRRGLEIFALAFLFRLQAYLLNPGAPASALLKVDILNVMGPAIGGAALVWGWCRSTRARAIAFALIAAGFAMLTPPVRGAAWIGALPDQIEAYLRPVPGLTNFTAFPWVGFVFAGAAAGTCLAAARTVPDERRVNVGLAVAGVLLSAGGYAASFLPPLYANSNFWTSSPTFFAMRVGVVSAAIALTYWFERWFGSTITRPLQVMGRASLFVYWIHIEMVYGVLATPIRRQLALPVMFAACAAFVVMLYGVVLIKEEVVARYRGR